MTNDLKLENNRKLLSTFLVDKSINPNHCIDREKYGDPFGYIYCIENKTNHKRYIGATHAKWTGVAKTDALTQIKKRASDYLYEYNRAKEEKTTSFSLNRPMIQAMVDEGFDNFIMYPIAETTRWTHKSTEKYFIEMYDTIKNGYNVLNAPSGVFRNSNYMSAAGKKSRGNEVIAINLNQKELIFSDSAKLFGDYMNSSKDMIKNCIRTGGQYKGWFIFYTDKVKRDNVNFMIQNNEVRIAHTQASEKRKRFYSEMCSVINSFLSDLESPEEYFPGFKVLDPLRYE